MNSMMVYFHDAVNFLFHIHDYLLVFTTLYGNWIYLLLFIIIFCETGIIVAAVLPGDSLLFAAGAIASSGGLNIYFLIGFLVCAAFIGNTINYWVGSQLGHWLFRNQKSLFFKQAHLKKTHVFYEKYGTKTIIIGSFLPIIRTFAPFVAGMSEMNPWRFTIANIIGVIIWMTVMLYGSYLFGDIPWIKRHFSVIVVAIIFISLLPPFVEWARVKIIRR